MTPSKILADCESRGIAFSARYMPELPGNRWFARVGGVENMRPADTFEAAVLAAWVAYTNAEGA